MAPATPPTTPPTIALVSDEPPDETCPVVTGTAVVTTTNVVVVPDVKTTLPSDVNEDWNVTCEATVVVTVVVVWVSVVFDGGGLGEPVVPSEQDVENRVAVGELEVMGIVTCMGTCTVVVPPPGEAV